MKTIWKFRLDVTGKQVIKIPEVAAFLSVQDQQGELCLWAIVEETSRAVERTIRIFGTGQAIPEGKRRYIGTAQQMGSALVWHIFEEED